MKKLKRSLLCFAMVFCIVFSLCGCEKNNAEDKETTAETILQTLHYSEEELEAMAENMPEIVFVMSHYINNSRNILGYFITNTGEIKMFDFEHIAPGELYDIPDVYDRLEEAVCQKFNIRIYDDRDAITADDLIPVPEEELKEKYKTLLCIDEECEYREYRNKLYGEGCYSAYGMRYNKDNEKELVLLHGEGEKIFERGDEISDELYGWLKLEEFPRIPYDYLWNR